MASRSLGTLTLDLIARIAGFQQGMDQAARIADTRSREIQRTFSKIGSAFTGIFAGLSVGLLLRKFVHETSEAQNAVAQLNAVLKSTGGAAGLSAPYLIKLSKEIQNITPYSDEAALGVETLLLQFNRLSGPEFKRATLAVADVATRLGRDLQPVALLVGKAFSGSAKGVEALRKAGVLFSKDELALIKTLAKANDVLGIQRLILGGLEKAAGGAAAAKLNTLGGAIDHFKTKFDDLFELDAGQTAGLVTAINVLAANLEEIARVAVRAGIAYGAFRAVLISAEVVVAAKNFLTLFNAIAAGNAVLISSEAAQAAKVVTTYREAQAATAVTEAELARTVAMVAGTRATYDRVVADEAATVSEAARLAVTRNVAGAEAAYATAAAAHVAAVRKVALQTEATVAAQATLAAKTSKLAGTFSLLLTPFRGIIAFATANPFVAIGVAVGAVVVGLVAFADKIKLSQDGVVTLENAAVATFQLIGEAIAPVTHAIGVTLVTAIDLVGAALKKIAPAVDFANEAFKRWLKTIPGVNLIAIALDKVFDKIEERARKLAADAEAARAKAEAVGTGAGVSTVSTTPTADPDALKKVQAMVDELQKQNITLDEGAVAALKYRIEFGDLKELFKSLGPEAEKYRKILIELTAEHEKFQKALEAKRAAKEATKQIQDQIIELETQIATFDKGEHAVFSYSLAHGDLAKTLKIVGPEAEVLRARLEKLNAELEKLQVAKQLRDIGIEILQLRGQTQEAIVLRFDIEHADLKEALTRAGDTAGLGQLEDLRNLTVKQAEFNELLKGRSRIEDELARQEERIRNSQEVGALTELEALGQIGDAREKTSVKLSEILAKLKAIADETGNEEMLSNVEQFKVQIESLQSKVELVAQKINGELKDSFSNALGDWVKGTKSFGDAFSDMLKDIQNKLIDLIAQNYIEQLFKGFGSSGSGGFGGFITKLFGFEKGGYLPPGQLGVAGEGGRPELTFSGRQHEIAKLVRQRSSPAARLGVSGKQSAIAKLVTRQPLSIDRVGIVGKRGAELIYGGARGLTIVNNRESTKLVELLRDARVFPLHSVPHFAAGGYLPPGKLGVAGEGRRSELTFSGRGDVADIAKLVTRQAPLVRAKRGEIDQLVTRQASPPGRLGVVGRKGAELVYGGTRGLTIINNRESTKLVELLRDARLFPLHPVAHLAVGDRSPFGRLGVAGEKRRSGPTHDNRDAIEKLVTQRSSPGRLDVVGKRGPTVVSRKESTKLVELLRDVRLFSPHPVLRFATGGYLPPGRVGIAGEGRKPELIFSGLGDVAKLVTQQALPPDRLDVVGRRGEELIYGGARGLTIINNRESMKLTELLRNERLFSLREVPRFATGGYLPPGHVGIAGDRGAEIIHSGRSDTLRIFRTLERALPSRDYGGRGYPGQPVMLGMKAQPELFIPDAPGRFVPNAELGGKQENHFHFTIQAPSGSVSRQTEQQIAAAAARGIARASQRSN